MDKKPDQVWALERINLGTEAVGLKPKGLLMPDWESEGIKERKGVLATWALLGCWDPTSLPSLAQHLKEKLRPAQPRPNAALHPGSMVVSGFGKEGLEVIVKGPLLLGNMDLCQQHTGPGVTISQMLVCAILGSKLSP